MGFWGGFAKGLQEYRGQQFETSEREAQQQFVLGRDEAERAFRREQMQAELRAQREQFILEKFGPGIGRRAGGSGRPPAEDTQNTQHYIDVLTQRYNVPEELILRVASSGDSNALSKAVEILDTTSTKYREEYGDSLPTDIITGMFETAIVTQPSEREIDWDSVSQYLGGDISPEFRDMLPDSEVIPGVTSFEEPVIRKRYGMEDIAAARKLAGEQVQAIATDNLQGLQDRVGRLNQIISDPSESEDRRAQATQLAIQAGDELVKVEAALEAANKGNYLPLIQIYGNEAMTYLKEYYPQLADAPLGIEFQE